MTRQKRDSAARVFRRLPEKNWWLEYENAAGGRTQARTQTASKAMAEALLADVLLHVWRQRGDIGGLRAEAASLRSAILGAK